MPDVTLIVQDLSGAEDAERLERAIGRLSFVELVNVDPEKGLVAVSYEGGEAELEKIGEAIEEAGHDYEPSPARSTPRTDSMPDSEGSPGSKALEQGILNL